MRQKFTTLWRTRFNLPSQVPTFQYIPFRNFTVPYAGINTVPRLLLFCLPVLLVLIQLSIIRFN